MWRTRHAGTNRNGFRGRDETIRSDRQTAASISDCEDLRISFHDHRSIGRAWYGVWIEQEHTRSKQAFLVETDDIRTIHWGTTQQWPVFRLMPWPDLRLPPW